MSFASLTEDHIDALRELTNIAMGRAGAGLGAIFDARVELHVPEIALISVAQLRERLHAADSPTAEYAVVRQAFYGKLRGEAIALYTCGENVALPPALKLRADSDETSLREFYLDTSNMLIGAVVGELVRQLSEPVGYSRPTLLSLQTNAADLVAQWSAVWDHALLLSVRLRVESEGFDSRLLVMIPEEVGGALRASLDTFLESM